MNTVAASDYGRAEASSGHADHDSLYSPNFRIGPSISRAHPFATPSPYLLRNQGTLAQANELPPRQLDAADPLFRTRIRQAGDTAIQTLQRALKQIDQPWTPETKQNMEKLFGKAAASEQAFKTTLKNKLQTLLHAVEASRQDSSHLYVSEGRPRSVLAQYDRSTGRITFFPNNIPDQATLVHTLLHEYAHAALGAKDHWYLDKNLAPIGDRQASVGGGTPPATGGMGGARPSGNAKQAAGAAGANGSSGPAGDPLDNADTLAKAAQVLASNG